MKMEDLKIHLPLTENLDDKTSSLTLKQFVSEVLDLSSQYGSDSSMSYTSFNLIGPPSVYPKYGDYADTFVLRTYGPWWDTLKSSFRSLSSCCKCDFVDILFEQKVYPSSIQIYETYNPGAIVRILALETVKDRWKVLWEDSSKNNLSTKHNETRHMHSKAAEEQARIFSPPIKSTDFPINILRLEFCHQHLDYYSELDAIMLCGSLIPIDLSLTSICEKLLNQKISPTLSVKPCNVLPVRDKSAASVKSTSTKNWFLHLPSEVITLVMSHLDLVSLCQAACACKLFLTYCYDSLLYTTLNLQLFWEKVTNNTLTGLSNRCHNLRELNLSWCGHYNHITSDEFVRFLCSCGTNLVCMKIGNCHFVNNNSLYYIAKICQKLQELDLRCCRSRDLDQRGFQELCNLKDLHSLNLYRTLIDLQSSILIIRSCQHLDYLSLGSCTGISNYDELIAEISRNCKHLKCLDVWRAKTLTSAGILQIAHNCSHLEELDVGWCMDVSSNSRCITELCERCPNIRKLILTAVRSVSDTDLVAISTYCRNLEQLDILGTRETTPLAIQRVLLECKRLKLLDISFCAQISDETVQLWRQTFPHVAIKKSYQNLSDST